MLASPIQYTSPRTDPKPQILLSFDTAAERDQVITQLPTSSSYSFTTDGTPQNIERPVDLWILDALNLERYHDAIDTFTDRMRPQYVPIVLVYPQERLSTLNSDVWEYIDDVIPTPMTPALLSTKLENQLEVRELSREVRHSQQRLESLVSTTSSVIFFLRLDGSIEYVNGAVKSLIGYDRTQLIGESVTQLIPSRLYSSMMDSILSYGDDIPHESARGSLETVGQHRDGHEIPIQCSYNWFELDETVFLTGIVTDISRLKHRETRLQVLNRVLRHDIRNDMNIIHGYAESLKESVPTEDHRIETILSVSDDVISLSEHARELDRLFTTDQTVKQRVDITELVESKCVDFRQTYPDVTIALECSLDTRPYVESISLLESAIDNLLENAIEHNDHDEPTVTVTISTVDNELVLVEIVDNGPGLPPDDARVIETATETALEHANGLGLWLVNWIVSESGGQITFSARNPRGSSITLQLPRGT